jgi:peptidoglycan/LPS O-acetylase OafA/YrhL
VLSGFLIIGKVWADLRKGTFSFWDFYGRRALRILPPYLIVLAACTAIGSAVLLSFEEIRSFGEELKASATMTINHLYFEQQGYFDSSADLKPLLNMWSLSVEEQFYLIIPAALALLAWALTSKCERVAWTVVAVLTGASLAGAIVGSTGEKNFGFYLAACRAWEFIAGGAIWFLRPTLARLSRPQSGQVVS